MRLGYNQIAAQHIGTTQSVSRIGRDLLNYGTLTIDYINRKYYFDAYSKRLKPARTNFGFTILTEPGKVTAGVVWENTPAQKNGMTSGVEIISINRKKFKHLNVCDIDTMLAEDFLENKIRIVFKKDKVRRIGYARWGGKQSNRADTLSHGGWRADDDGLFSGT